MRQTRQGVRSTKVPDEDALLEQKPTPGVKYKEVYLRVYDPTRKQMYTDQSGPFPRKSRRNKLHQCGTVENKKGEGSYRSLPTDLPTMESHGSHLPQWAYPR
jgi:hypothetical protein